MFKKPYSVQIIKLNSYYTVSYEKVHKIDTENRIEYRAVVNKDIFNEAQG